VPIVSVIYGVDVSMFYQEHEPPHYHAEYQGQRAVFDFRGRVLAGRIRSRTARRLIRQWAIRHGDDLARNWAKLKAGLPLDRIAPLE
jgi:hypothetical protein